jgi:hypothetical protein
MQQDQFCYWLQGFFEISDSNKLTEKQVQIIKDHLALVFDKQTPDRNAIQVPTSKGIDAQEEMRKALQGDGFQKICSVTNSAGSLKPTVYC